MDKGEDIFEVWGLGVWGEDQHIILPNTNNRQ